MPERTSLEHALSWVDAILYDPECEIRKETGSSVQVAEGETDPDPQLLIQPFIENAMKYAFTEKSGQWEILIAARMTGDQLHIFNRR